jgi:signal transduction histidine kinase
VVHGIVTAHGGRIDVESREGEGSRFTIRLPVAGSGPQDAPEKLR